MNIVEKWVTSNLEKIGDSLKYEINDATYPDLVKFISLYKEGLLDDLKRDLFNLFPCPAPSVFTCLNYSMGNCRRTWDTRIKSCEGCEMFIEKYDYLKKDIAEVFSNYK